MNTSPNIEPVRAWAPIREDGSIVIAGITPMPYKDYIEILITPIASESKEAKTFSTRTTGTTELFEIDRLKAQLAQKEAEIERLNNQNQGLHVWSSKWESENAELKKEITRLHDSLNEECKRVDELKKENYMGMYEQERFIKRTLENELNKARSENSELKKEVDIIRSYSQEFMETISKLNQELQLSGKLREEVEEKLKVYEKLVESAYSIISVAHIGVLPPCQEGWIKTYKALSQPIEPVVAESARGQVSDKLSAKLEELLKGIGCQIIDCTPNSLEIEGIKPIPEKPIKAEEPNALKPELHKCTDTRVWANEFNKVLESFGHTPLKVDWLAGWFDNAMMAKHDAIRSAMANEGKK